MIVYAKLDDILSRVRRLIRSWSLDDSQSVILHTTYQQFLSTCGVWIWRKSNLFWLIAGPTHLRTSCLYQNEFDPQQTTIECTSVKRPHHLQACPLNLQKHTTRCCKHNNQPHKKSSWLMRINTVALSPWCRKRHKRSKAPPPENVMGYVAEESRLTQAAEWVPWNRKGVE